LEELRRQKPAAGSITAFIETDTSPMAFIGERPVFQMCPDIRRPEFRENFRELIIYTASRHIPFQQVLGAQHRPLENEHRPPSGMQVCRPALATEVKGVKKTPITINRAPAIFNNEVLFILFSFVRYELLRYCLH
jgi:hypothetical protein